MVVIYFSNDSDHGMILVPATIKDLFLKKISTLTELLVKKIQKLSLENINSCDKRVTQHKFNKYFILLKRGIKV